MSLQITDLPKLFYLRKQYDVFYLKTEFKKNIEETK